MVSLHQNGNYVCGGTLIASDWVMTAAQCLRSSVDVSEWSVGLGLTVHNISYGFKGSVRVLDVTTSSLSGSNIALLRLDTNVSYTGFILPICLAGASVSFPTGTECWVTSWDKVWENLVLKEVKMKITPCENVSPADSICTEPLNLEQRDSGSPLVCKQGSVWIQASVIDVNQTAITGNRSSTAVRALSPGVFTRVSRYESFLRSVLGSSLPLVNNTTVTPTTTTPVSIASSTTTTTAAPLNICGRPKINTPLLGGQPASEGSWPWMVSLHQNGRHACGGTIIASNWVLTAAQCLPSSVNLSEWRVYVGRLKQNGTNPFERSLGVLDVKSSQQGGTNIALLKLDANVSFTDYTLPACLAGEAISFAPGTKCWVTGWGNTTGTGEQALQQLNTTIVPCATASSDSSICIDSLFLEQGDSGGPLVCKQDAWVQASVIAVNETASSVKLSSAQVRAVKVGSFVKVSQFVTFLRANVPNLPVVTPKTDTTTKPSSYAVPQKSHSAFFLASLPFVLVTWMSTL